MKYLLLNKLKNKNIRDCIKILILILYFVFNIVNIGDFGTALPMLVIFFAISIIDLPLNLFRGNLVVKFLIFNFAVVVIWLSIRIIIDTHDFEYLKQLTIATTSGVVLFFLLGGLTRQVLSSVINLDKGKMAKLLVIMLIMSSVYLLIKFNDRLLDRIDIFFIEGADEGYQRSGNFMIILFILNSFLHLSITARLNPIRKTNFIFFLTIYSFNMIINLINSQMIGSNAATANIFAMYLMTIVLSFFSYKIDVRNKYIEKKLDLPLSIGVLKLYLKYSFIVIFFGFIAAILVVKITGFDLNKTRIFGFGAGENISLSSRFEILKETGMNQMGYCPIWGNVNVATIVTGDAGERLHNFIPNVIAELGVIGLIFILNLFALVIINLFNLIKKSDKDEIGFMEAILNSWLLFDFVFLFLYANIAVGKEWSVIWFFIGFSINLLGDKSKKLC